MHRPQGSTRHAHLRFTCPAASSSDGPQRLYMNTPGRTAKRDERPSPLASPAPLSTAHTCWLPRQTTTRFAGSAASPAESGRGRPAVEAGVSVCGGEAGGGTDGPGGAAPQQTHSEHALAAAQGWHGCLPAPWPIRPPQEPRSKHAATAAHAHTLTKSTSKGLMLMPSRKNSPWGLELGGCRAGGVGWSCVGTRSAARAEQAGRGAGRTAGWSVGGLALAAGTRAAQMGSGGASLWLCVHWRLRRARDSTPQLKLALQQEQCRIQDSSHRLLHPQWPLSVQSTPW